MNNTLNIVIHEPSKKSRNSLQLFYENVFNGLGYENLNFIEYNSDVGSSDPSGVEFPGDVFICDLSLGAMESFDGFKLIHLIRRDYPHLFIIANSSSSVTFAQASAHFPTFDLFVYKSKMYDEEYKRHITREVETKFRTNVYLHFDNINISEINPASTQEEDLVNQIKITLKQITFTTHSPEQNAEITEVTLSELSGGYSGSHVYRMKARTGNGIECINAVLKVSDKEEYNKEKNNYLRYVKWYLPYNWRPELIGYAESKDFGALCYSFVYNDEVSFKSLTEYLIEADYEKLGRSIEDVFDPTKTRWYNSNNFINEHNGSSLTKYYYEKWYEGRDPNLSENRFCSVIGKYGDLRNEVVVVNKLCFKKPQCFLLGHDRLNYISSIRHGDLNSNNIFLSKGGETSFIDFSDTGRGHVFEDFVVFEACIRLNIELDISFPELLDFEIALAQSTEQKNASYTGNIETGKYILQLRQYAKRTCPAEPIGNYFYALALYCFRLLRVDDYKPKQYERIVACLLGVQLSLQKHEGVACSLEEQTEPEPI